MKITNNNNPAYPEPLLNMARETLRQPIKDEYSVTELLKGVKEIVLTRRHWRELEQDVSDMVWALFGTAIHKVFETYDKRFGIIREKRFYRELYGKVISGQPDAYDHNEHLLEDYKSTSVWAYVYGSYEKDWLRQGLGYAWLLEGNGHQVESASFWAIFKDYSEHEKMRNSNYPGAVMQAIHFSFELEDIEYIEASYRGKLLNIMAAETMSDDDIEPCEPVERWAQETVYAVMKPGRKSAVRLLDSRQDAEDYIRTENVKDGYVVERPGEDRKCMRYCLCKDFCSYYKERYGGEENG